MKNSSSCPDLRNLAGNPQGTMSMADLPLPKIKETNASPYSSPGVSPLTHHYFAEKKKPNSHSAEGGPYDKSTIVGNLLDHAANGDLSKVQDLCHKYPELVSTGDYDKRTALHLAASEGRLNVVKFLLSSKANFNAKDRWGGTPLSDAKREGHSDVQDTLRQAGASTPTQRKEITFTPSKRVSEDSDLNFLLDAAAKGNIGIVKKLCEENPKLINTGDYDKRTALHLAASEGQTEVVEYLLGKADADVNLKTIINFQDRWGGTPLSDAVREGHTVVANILKKHGGKEDKDFVGLSAYELETKALSSRAKKEKWFIAKSELKIEKERFASGAGGNLFKAKWRGLDVCVKTMKRFNSNMMLATPMKRKHQQQEHSPAPSPDQSNDTTNALQDLMNEISILSTLRHPQLVLFLGASIALDETTTSSHPPMLITEFMPGGNLRELLIRQSKQQIELPLKTINRWTMQFALGMNFLHNCHPPIIHRDLKPENLLFTSTDTNVADLKIADFGLGKVFHSSTGMVPYTMTGGTGSYRYMAPEVFSATEHDGVYKYDEKVDVYSWALIVWSMYSGERPFNAIQTPLDIIKATARKDNSEASLIRPAINVLPLDVAPIVSEAWSQQPQDRPSFDEIVERLRLNEKQEAKMPNPTDCCVIV
eukprot:g4191.t1